MKIFLFSKSYFLWFISYLWRFFPDFKWISELPFDALTADCHFWNHRDRHGSFWQLLLDWPAGFLKEPVGVKLLKIDRKIVCGQERGLVFSVWPSLSWRSGMGKSCFQNKSWFVNNQLIRYCWFVCHVMVVCHLIADL